MGLSDELVKWVLRTMFTQIVPNGSRRLIEAIDRAVRCVILMSTR
jgi:hypothetical protein